MKKQFTVPNLALALVAGLAIGAAAGFHAQRWCWGWFQCHDMTSRIVDRFSRDLNLTSDQRTRLTTILTASRARMKKLHQDLAPRFEGIRSETAAAIEKILTPEQVMRYRELKKKREASRKRSGSGHDRSCAH